MFDLLITDGDVIDGRGGPRRRADVGIVGDRVSAIGNLLNGGGAQAAATIDAAGLAVTPGFIDVRTHLDSEVFRDPDLSPPPLHRGGVIPALSPFEDRALELMTDMSVAARSPLNWNVMSVDARSLEMNRAKPAVGDHAAAGAAR